MPPPAAPALAGLICLILAVGCGGGSGTERADGGADVGAPDGSGPQPSPEVIVTATDGSPAGTRLTLFAWQDGDGPWQALAPTDGVHRFRPTAGRYGVALLCRGLGVVEVILAHSSELQRIPIRCNWAEPGVHHWRGAIRGLGQGEFASVGFYSRAGPAPANSQMTPGSYTVYLDTGTYDVVGTISAAVSVPRFVLIRDLVVAGPGDLDLDFTAAATRLEERNLSVAAGPGELVSGFVELFTRNGARTYFTGSGGARIHALARKDLGAGDQQMLEVSASLPDDERRGIRRALPAEGVPPIDLPVRPLSPRFSLASAAPVIRPRVGFEAHPDVTFYRLSASEFCGSQGYDMTVSRAWLGGAHEFEFPDLSALPSFAATDFIRSPRNVEYTLEAVASTRGLSAELRRDPTADAADVTTWVEKRLLTTLTP